LPNEILHNWAVKIASSLEEGLMLFWVVEVYKNLHPFHKWIQVAVVVHQLKVWEVLSMILHQVLGEVLPFPLVALPLVVLPLVVLLLLLLALSFLTYLINLVHFYHLLLLFSV